MEPDLLIELLSGVVEWVSRRREEKRAGQVAGVGQYRHQLGGRQLQAQGSSRRQVDDNLDTASHRGFRQ